MKGLSLLTIAAAAVAVYYVGELRDQRDAALARAAQAETDAREALELLNGRTAVVEVRNGARVYTVFKPRQIVVKPIVLAEAQ